MDERLRICLWMMGGGGFGSVLGSVFGALAAALYAKTGGEAGTHLARSTVENFLQLGERQSSPIRRAALVGAADGFYFLGTVGLAAGAFLGKSGWPTDELFLPMMLGGELLIGGAVLFGTLAYGLTYQGAQFLYGLAGSILGSIIVGSLLGSVYGSAGCVVGMFAGWLFCRAVRCYSPRFDTPRVGKTAPQPRSHTDTDFTGSMPSPSNVDFVRKPDSIEEG